MRFSTENDEDEEEEEEAGANIGAESGDVESEESKEENQTEGGGDHSPPFRRPYSNHNAFPRNKDPNAIRVQQMA